MLDFEAVTTIVCLGPSGWGARRIAWMPGIARNTVGRGGRSCPTQVRAYATALSRISRRGISSGVSRFRLVIPGV